ncbi:hypothetical protein DFH29DRAFT_999675 [Suillus ampliporus]|nr:hypothetical protein DFH29DRAFT_999675 [Suillus ampliporus]
MSGCQFVAVAFNNLVLAFDEAARKSQILYSITVKILYLNIIIPLLYLVCILLFFPLELVALRMIADLYSSLSLPKHPTILTFLTDAFNITIHIYGFDDFSKELVGLSSSVIQSAACHLKQEKALSELTSEQKKVLHLLQHVNTISAKIPGSQAFKTLM